MFLDLFGRFVKVIFDPLINDPEIAIHEEGAQISGIFFLGPVADFVKDLHDGRNESVFIHPAEERSVLIRKAQHLHRPVFCRFFLVLFVIGFPFVNQFEYEQVFFAAFFIEIAIIRSSAHARLFADGGYVDGIIVLCLHHF